MVRCGFAFIPHPAATDTIHIARTGEDLGFESAWLPDQTFYSDPFVLLAACAGATRRITLGLGVTNPYTRHPALVARAAATLDELSGGRFVLAYGAGNLPELLRPLGIERTAAAARLREAVLVTKALVRGETVHHRSPTLVADDVQLLTPPRPTLRVYVAARSPGTMRVAGEVADGVILGSLFSSARLGPALEQVARGAAAAQRSPAAIDQVLWGSSFLTDFPGGDVDAFKVEIGRVIGRAGAATLRSGALADERIDEFRAAHTAGGAAAVGRLLTDDEIRGMSLFGDAATCRAALRDLEASGISRFILLLRQASPERHVEQLTFFARNVLA